MLRCWALLLYGRGGDDGDDYSSGDGNDDYDSDDNDDDAASGNKDVSHCSLYADHHHYHL